uniref:MSP domain-containing protein n=1 Tax=Globodera pallida TaxID=36090 RepID=A0A183C094_GLOPA
MPFPTAGCNNAWPTSVILKVPGVKYYEIIEQTKPSSSPCPTRAHHQQHFDIKAFRFSSSPSADDGAFKAGEAKQPLIILNTDAT